MVRLGAVISIWGMLLVAEHSILDCRADDWPQWMGPNRDGVWNEAEIVRQFPAGGPKKLWSAKIGGGYAGPAVAGGKVFVCGYVRRHGDPTNNPALKNTLEGQEEVYCFDARTGKELWRYEYDCPYRISYPAGPRCTPTIADNRVYTLGAMGNLICFDTNSGKVIWAKDFKKSHNAQVPTWGFAGHPLVYKDFLICLVGGENGSLLVAFDRQTGNERWRSLSTSTSDGPGYCSPCMIRQAQQEQLVFWEPRAVHGLDPDTGKEVWSIPLVPKYGMSIMAPRFYQSLLFAGGIGGDSICIKLSADLKEARVLWRGNARTAVCPVNVTPIIDEGILYGICQDGALRAVNLATGERLWSTFQPVTGAPQEADYRGSGSGTAFLVKNQENYLLFAETGHLILARLSPEKYSEFARFHLIKPTGEAFGRKVVWSHPAFAERAIFVRNDEEIACFSLTGE